MRLVSIENVRPGVSLGKSIFDSYGRVLLTKGTTLYPQYIKRLRNLKYKSLYIIDGISESVTIDDIVSEETRLEVFQLTREALMKVSVGDTFEEKKIKKVVTDVVEEILNNKDIIIHLTDIKSMQDHTFGHSVNVCIMSIMTGISMGYDEQKLMELGTGALLHDIGKAKILEEVNKEERLTEQVYRLIQKHCEFGWEILKNSDDISIFSAHIALEHHERFDGSGYPRKLSGKGIMEYARIVAVADVYDALASDRPYRDRMLPHEVINYIESKQGTEFDPDIVTKFIPNIAPYPVGSLVILNSGMKGIVVTVNKKCPSKPIVKLIYDENGSKIEESYFVNLATEQSVYVSEVVKQ